MPAGTDTLYAANANMPDAPASPVGDPDLSNMPLSISSTSFTVGAISNSTYLVASWSAEELGREIAATAIETATQASELFEHSAHALSEGPDPCTPALGWKMNDQRQMTLQPTWLSKCRQI
jgi:hypothetical protein